jgi:hypothetical protein
MHPHTSAHAKQVQEIHELTGRLLAERRQEVDAAKAKSKADQEAALKAAREEWARDKDAEVKSAVRKAETELRKKWDTEKVGERERESLTRQ